MRKKPNGDSFLEQGVLDLLVAAARVCRQERFSSTLVEQNRTTRSRVEVIGLQLLTVQKREDESVGKTGSELLHEIQSQRRSSRADGMKEANLRIKPDSLKGGDTILRQQCVAEGKRCVDRISRRSLRPRDEWEPLGTNELGEHCVVQPRCSPFDPADAVNGRLRFQLPF